MFFFVALCFLILFLFRVGSRIVVRPRSASFVFFFCSCCVCVCVCVVVVVVVVSCRENRKKREGGTRRQERHRETREDFIMDIVYRSSSSYSSSSSPFRPRLRRHGDTHTPTHTHTHTHTRGYEEYDE